MRKLTWIVAGLLLTNGCAGLLESGAAGTGGPPSTQPSAPLDPTAQAIELVLVQDQQNFNATSQRLEMGVPELQAFAQYMETMNAIDLRGCPPDFREAFARHTAAWDEVYRFASTRSNAKRWIGVLKSVLRKDVEGAAEGVLTPDAREHARLKEGIHRTWVEVEVLAAKYGARKP